VSSAALDTREATFTVIQRGVWHALRLGGEGATGPAKQSLLLQARRRTLHFNLVSIWKLTKAFFLSSIWSSSAGPSNRPCTRIATRRALLSEMPPRLCPEGVAVHVAPSTLSALRISAPAPPAKFMSTPATGAMFSFSLCFAFRSRAFSLAITSAASFATFFCATLPSGAWVRVRSSSFSSSNRARTFLAGMRVELARRRHKLG